VRAELSENVLFSLAKTDVHHKKNGRGISSRIDSVYLQKGFGVQPYVLTYVFLFLKDVGVQPLGA